jgi:hypothetical protein
LLIIATIVYVALRFVLPLTAKQGFRRRWKPVQATVNLGNIGSITICPDDEIACVAHQAWVEIMTRKAGLLLDERNDVIVEVYNSWYQLFGELRKLIRSIPADTIRDSDDAKKLVDILMKAMNDGLRPHLTRWQAKFRVWYDNDSKERGAVAPQERQRDYPEYAGLIEDLESVNVQMAQFADVLKQIAHGR